MYLHTTEGFEVCGLQVLLSRRDSTRSFKVVPGERWVVDKFENVFHVASLEVALHILCKKLYEKRRH